MPDTNIPPPSQPADPPAAARRRFKHLAMLLFKILIAVAGIWYVIHNVTWLDSATVKGGSDIRNVQLVSPVEVEVLRREVFPARPPAQERSVYWVRFPSSFPADAEVQPGKTQRLTIDDHNREQFNFPRVIDLPAQDLEPVAGAPAAPGAPPELVHHGLRSTLLAASARWYLLLAAWAILAIPFLVSAWRWQGLMHPQGLHLPYSKCLQLTFVGQFYSIMLPGITGGDLFKIVYTASLTGSKTKSTITILLDRVCGLVALMVIAGFSAGLQLLKNRHRAGAAALVGDTTLRNIVLLIAASLAALTVFSTIYFSRRLRVLTGLQRFIDHSRMPDFVKHADEVLHLYRGHFGLLAWAFVISVVSQLTLPVSAWLAGTALGMDAHVGYYLAYVPIAVLASSLPISFQGIGVMDAILLHFFVNRGTARAGQVFALTQAIRFLPILWNLVGAYWVVTGRFSRHATKEPAKSQLTN